jgi:hypothetical protein
MSQGNLSKRSRWGVRKGHWSMSHRPGRGETKEVCQWVFTSQHSSCLIICEFPLRSLHFLRGVTHGQQVAALACRFSQALVALSSTVLVQCVLDPSWFPGSRETGQLLQLPRCGPKIILAFAYFWLLAIVFAEAQTNCEKNHSQIKWLAKA